MGIPGFGKGTAADEPENPTGAPVRADQDGANGVAHEAAQEAAHAAAREVRAEVHDDAERAGAHARDARHAAEDARRSADVADADRLQVEVESEDFVRDHLPPDEDDPHAFGRLGRPLSTRSPFVTGFFLAAGALLAFWLGGLILQAGSVLILIVVALFLAFGLNPVVEFFMHRGLRRPWAVLIVTLLVVAAIALFVMAIAPVIGDQIRALTKNAPTLFDQLQHNRTIQSLNDKYDVITKLNHYVTSGHLTQRLFGGVLGVGLAILSALANAFVVVVLTLYFLASLPKVKRAIYDLAPASRRERVSKLGDEILSGVGGYVSGAFLVALCAGLSTLVFLFIVGLGQYAVALAFVVALLDVIPMIGATLGAIIVCAIGFATSPHVGIACVIFYIAYQQLENYVIYPRVMSHSVDIPGAMTVIAALIGAALLGVIGALLAIPTAAAGMLLVREVFIKRQDQR